MKKVLVVVSIILMAVFGYGITEITYMTFSALPNQEQTLDMLVKEFQKQNPDIKINIVKVPWDGYFTKLSTMFAGGNAPDTFEINYENFVDYANDGLLMNLDDLNKKFGFNVSKEFTELSAKAFSLNNKQYGFPESFSTVVLIYNKDLFDKYKVSYPTEKWTWKDEMAAAKKLTDKKAGIWGDYQPVQFWEFYKVLEQNKNPMITKGKSHVNTKEGVEALKWLTDKISTGVMPSDEEMAGLKSEDLFVSGRLAMVHTGIWMFGMFREQAKFNWDIAVEPGNKSKASHYFANAVVMSAKSNKKEAAWKWMKFLTASEFVSKLRFDKGWELPAVSNQKYLAPFIADKSLPKNKKAIFDSLKYSVVPPIVKGWGQLSDYVNNELSSVILKVKSPEEALKNIENEINSKIK